MPNPGPASIVAQQNMVVSQNEYRLLGVLKALSVAAAGDTAFPCLCASGWIAPAQVVTSNSGQNGSSAVVNVAAATVGVYTAPAQGGSVILTTAVLTGQTTAAFAYIRAATNPATALTGVTTFYANVGTVVAGGIIDLYVYGYDLS
jgi:hypothetical protein